MMAIQLMAQGKDNLGNFKLNLPGYCESCEKGVEASIKYQPMNITKSLEKMGVDPKLPSLILKRPWEIGVTCGCYARAQRQIAHITHGKKLGKEG